ncbi:MAG: alpha/beta fold hydrolase [Acidobacteriota bacterium]
MELVILPGMDGTGILSQTFANHLPGDFSVTIVRYPSGERQSYAELEFIARSALPENRPFLLLGESFSGPIAISLAASNPTKPAGLILCCSFARNPYQFLRPFGSLSTLVNVRAIPLPVLSGILLGRWSTPALRSLLQEALSIVPPAVLQARASAVLTVDAVDMLRHLQLPLLYLKGSEDRLIPPAAATLVLENAPDTRLEEIPGPHLLLQAAPERCARVITDFANRQCRIAR